MRVKVQHMISLKIIVVPHFYIKLAVGVQTIDRFNEQIIDRVTIFQLL